MNNNSERKIGRREFVGTTTAAAAGLLFVKPEMVRGSAANSAVRVGLLGCGGRGTTVAKSMIENGGARVTAVADLFADSLEAAKKNFPDAAANAFGGARAAQQIVASKEIDAVIIASPPYFHPEHLELAVAAGKHVYLEKPVAVDVHGCKRVIRAGEKATGKLSLDVGFQIRNAPPFVEMVRRIHAGAIGKIVTAQTYYYTGALRRPEWPGASPEQRRLRDWVYDRVLSGDILVEQGIHVVDICNWVMQTHPVKASATGGRKARTDHGDCYDHYNILYTYPDNVHVSFNSTQFLKGWWDVCERFMGTKGVSESHYSGGVKIMGDEPWDAFPNAAQAQQSAQFSATGSFSDALKDADPEKHKAFIQSIASGQFHNQAQHGADSALTGILARTAAYTGKEITWEQLLKSDEKWDAKLDISKLA